MIDNPPAASNTQLKLFSTPAVDISALSPLPKGSSGWSNTERFVHFHLLNPHVYWSLRQLALHLRGDVPGRPVRVERIGIDLLFGQMRWQALGATEGGEFKLNNNHCAFYARVLMAHDPARLSGLFRLREQKSVQGSFVADEDMFHRLELPLPLNALAEDVLVELGEEAAHRFVRKCEGSRDLWERATGAKRANRLSSFAAWALGGSI